MRILMRRRTAATLAVAAIAIPSVVAMAAPRTLSGTVAYRERMALPPSAVLEVQLVDVSRTDAPAAVVAQATIQPAGQVPIPFRLQFDDSAVVAGRTYALQAKITVDDVLWFTNTDQHAVSASGGDRIDIFVRRVAVDRSTDALPLTGAWLAEDIRGGGVIDRLQTVLQIGDDGSVGGTGGCNRMSGRASIAGEKITFGPIAATQMACTPAAMDQERKFFTALGEVRAWRIDQVRRKLTLLDADGKPLVVLARM